MNQNYKPIDGLPLINDGWVFFIYGWIIASLMARYEEAGASLDNLENLAMEPFSFGAFFGIAVTGFLLVLATVSILEYKFKKSTEYIRNFFLLKRVFIPISEVGLSTGAIIMGMSCGIAFKFSHWGAFQDQSEITKTTLSIAIMIAFVYWPIFWQQRSILAIGKIENFKFNLIGLIYIGSCGILIYLSNIKMFVFVSAFTAFFTAGAYYFMVFRKRKKQAK